jgi:hypothetical protein
MNGAKYRIGGLFNAGRRYSVGEIGIIIFKSKITSSVIGIIICN